MVGPIRFTFSLEKLLNLMAYLAGKVQRLDIMKAVKLLYFIDKQHLVRNGRTIVGDTYYKLNKGPVPTASYDIMKDPDPEFEPGEFSDRDTFLERFAVDSSHGYPVFSARHDPDMECFSDSEIETIDAVTDRLGHLNGYQLMILSHKDATHQRTSLGCPIDFRLFFEDEPSASYEAFELMESEQEDRDFCQGLASD